MAHDYAKKTRSAPRRKPKSASRKPPANTAKSPVPGWVWLLVGCLVGAFVMFLVRLADVDVKASDKPVAASQKPAAEAKPATKPQATKPAQAAKPAPEPNPTKAQTAKAEPTEPEKPRFDFYHMLKENEVPVPKVDSSGAQATAAPPKSYILQVASFRKAEDAEQLKVELILLNLEARAESVTVRNGEQWHRVLVGPFDSRSRLSKARSTLISNGHQALVMEHKPKS